MKAASGAGSGRDGGGRSAGRRVLPRVPPLASGAPKWRLRRAARTLPDTAPRTRHGGGGSAGPRPRPPQGPAGGFVPRGPVLPARAAAEPPLPRFSATVTQAGPGAPPVGAVSEAGVTPRLPHPLTGQGSLPAAGALWRGSPPETPQPLALRYLRRTLPSSPHPSGHVFSPWCRPAPFFAPRCPGTAWGRSPCSWI